ncbi:hypothetical protein KGY63_05675, partial [Candidatus Bipolaricaulota bacterium]|nr:hypothetical protein [Candidatus Bipolaricaulota bacterium]
MSKKGFLIFGVVVLSLILVNASLAMGQDVSTKLSRVIRVELELDSDVYRVIETEYRGEKVILIAIFGNEKALNSSLNPDIKSAIRQNMEKTPLAISVLTRNKQAKFHPYALRIVQNNEETSPKNVIGITDGFNDGDMPEKVPIEGEVFWGSKGIITLGADFDTSSPFNLKYGTSSAHFSLSGQETEMDKVMEGKEESLGEREGIGDTNTSPNESEGLSGT